VAFEVKRVRENGEAASRAARAFKGCGWWERKRTSTTTTTFFPPPSLDAEVQG